MVLKDTKKDDRPKTGGDLFDKLRKFTIRVHENGDGLVLENDYARIIREMSTFLSYGGPIFAGLESCFEDILEQFFLLEVIGMRGTVEFPFLVVIRKVDIYCCAFKAGGKWYEYKSQHIFQELFGVKLSESGIDSDYELHRPVFGPSMLFDLTVFFSEGKGLISKHSTAQNYMEVFIRLYCEPIRIRRLFDFIRVSFGGQFYEKFEISIQDMNIIKLWGSVSDATIDAKFAVENRFVLDLTPDEMAQVNVTRSNVYDSIGLWSYNEAQNILGLLKVEKDSRIESRLPSGKELLKSNAFRPPKSRKPNQEESSERFWHIEFNTQSTDIDMKSSFQKFQTLIADGKFYIAENLLKKLGIYRVEAHGDYYLNDRKYKLPGYLFNVRQR